MPPAPPASAVPVQPPLPPPVPPPVPHLLLVEDDADFAAWVGRVLLPMFPNARLVHAASRDQALRALRLAAEAGAPWTLAIVDLNLPDGTGIDIIARLAALQAPVLVVTAVEQPDVALAAIRAGASGYLVKSTLDNGLRRTVEQLLAGGSPITPAIARLLLLEFRQQGAAAPAEADLPDLPAPIAEKLTERETEVLRLLARGYGNKEIAARLGMSTGTADSHVRNIYRKLSVNSRAQLRSIVAA